MTASRPDNEAIFHAARDIADPDRRREYVREACGGDETRIDLVEALLAAADRTDSLLDRPLAGTPVATIDRPTTERPGTVIGPYKLIEQIGEGGMGNVWMAQQTAPVKRLVALKLIKAGMDSRQVIARFEAERQALALMDHANIARVLAAGTSSAGRPYFVMDLVKGMPITRYCDEHHLTPRQRLELFIPVCQAVQHAHQKGVIHRDLKPSNVLVALYDGKPVPKVIDFGLAKATGQQLTDKTLVTGFGAIVGTLEYMSPEQAEVNQLDIDTRSDIYSLGVLLYELLAGSPPFSRKALTQAGMLEMLRVIREQEPTKPSTKLSTADGLPTLAANRGTEPAKLTKLLRGEVDWIVMKALEKDRTRRYETANDFAMDVQRYLADEAVQACPPSARYRLRKFVRRHQGPVVAALVVVLALVGGIVGTTWGMIRATTAEAEAVSEGKQKERALQDAQDRLFESLWRQAQARRFSRQMGQRLDSLDALAQAARIRPDERLRDEAIAALALPDVRRVPGWRSAPPETVSVAYGAQYRLYARADARGVIRIGSIPDDQEIQRIASGPILGTHLLFSPDDRFLLGLGEGHTLHVWSVADRQPALRDEPRDCHGHAFRPDGRRLAVSQQDWILVFDLATGQEVKRWRLPARASTLAFDPSGARLAVGYFVSSVVSVYDAANGTLLADLPVGQITDQIVAWHPDGRRLAVSGSDPRIQVWDVAAPRKLATLEGHVQPINALTFHPEGDLLASHGWDGQLLLWQSSSGRLLLRLTSASTPQFSADGRWLGVAWEGDRADFLEVTPSREYRTLVNGAGTGQGGYDFGDISPDGRVLVVGIDSGARLWHLGTGRELAALPEGTPFVFFEGKGRGKGDSGTSKRPSWSLLTGGAGGLRRWPVTSDDPERKCLNLGPPQQLSPLERAFFGRSPDGRTLAAVTVEGETNQILDLETGAVRRKLGPHPGGEVRALSGDGRWAASCGWHSDRVGLWNVGTGEKVKEWVVGQRTRVFFTPDSRALIISRGEAFSFWDVETFELIRRIPRNATPFPGSVAFSPDGRLMALEMAPGVLHLKEAATGRTVARLEDPHGDRPSWLGFTPDGTRLVVATGFASLVHVWDLRAIRTRLKAMNLDWDWPEFPNGTDASLGNALTEDQKLDVTILDPISAAKAHTDRGSVLHQQGKLAEALAAFEEALRLQPDNARAHFGLASVLAHSKQWDRSARVYAAALKRFSTPRWPALSWYEPIRSDEVFTRLTAEQPDDRLPWIMRARLHVFQHDWKRAAADYARVNESWASIDPAELARESGDLFDYACLLLLLGDRPGYEQFCKKWADRVGDSPFWGYCLARVWGVSPRPVVPAQQIVERAGKALQTSPAPQNLHALSLAHYRNGEFERAIERALESNGRNWRGSAKALNWVVLAMAQSRLGHAADARKSLRQALELAGRASPEQLPGVEWPEMTPPDVVEFELLRREAGELINAKSKEKPVKK